MRVSYRWIQELLPSLTATAAEVGETLTRIGLELEELAEFGAGLEPVVLAEVQSIAPHPERDKLQLVTVGLGGSRTQTVVCGARNVPAPGGLVVLAPLGTYLPAIGLKLEPKKLGGIVSEGMLCSETELGLGSESQGILTFAPGTFTPGTPFRTAFPQSHDTIFSIGVTPNRPDALGHHGIARDLAAAFELDFQPPAVATFEQHAPSAAEKIRIENRAPERCPAYGAAFVQGVTVAPSPEWLRWRLTSLGVRPISNVVDITNWLLLEFGNPMHAFDFNQVADGKLIIRTATSGEKMTTLDGVERELLPTDLVIADARGASALAGIMGSRGSEISATTRDVLLECAYFEPRGVRRTSRRLALSTDSSYRFERGVDFTQIDRVLQRACSLLAQLAGGKVSAGIVRQDGTLPKPSQVTLRMQRAQQLLGYEVKLPVAVKILQRLGFTCVQQGDGQVTVETRPARPDVSLEADLIEEVARIIGLDAIPTVLPAIKPSSAPHHGQTERRLRQLAASLGLSETVTYSFVSRQALADVGAPAPIVELLNPLTEERSVMTTSLLPGLVEVAVRARRHGESDLRLFSIASTFEAALPSTGADTTVGERPRDAAEVGVLPLERPRFAALLCGDRTTYLTKAEPLDVFDAKGFTVELLERLLGYAVSVVGAPEDAALGHLHPRGRAHVVIGERRVGTLGPLHPDLVTRLELPSSTQIVELDVFALESIGKRSAQYRAIPRLPAITRDIALEASDTLHAADILATIRNSAGDLCESAELFDLFKPSAPKARRSLAFRVVYRDPKAATDPEKARTLTDKEVDKQHQQVLDAVKKLDVSLKM